MSKPRLKVAAVVHRTAYQLPASFGINRRGLELKFKPSQRTSYADHFLARNSKEASLDRIHKPRVGRGRIVGHSMKIVCAWCGKVLNENSAKEVSHVICPECYDREMLPFVEEQRRAREDEEPKLRPQPFDWFDFLHRQMLFSLMVGGLFFAILLAAEGCHWITGGKMPSLIEWIVKLPSATGHQNPRSPDPENDLDSYRESDNTAETSTPNQGRANESAAK